MNIVVDVGNTNIYMGVFQEEELLATFRTATDVMKSRDEYEIVFLSFLAKNHIERETISDIMIASVVPMMNGILKGVIRNVFGFEPLFLAQGVKTGLAIRIDNPSETGSDLIADCVGAIAKYGNGLLIVDLGTASKILVVDNRGDFVGGVIMAGMQISMEALAKNTANLNEIDLSGTRKVIGKNTIECINSGLINGNKHMINGLCEDIEKELGYHCKRILTGGYANLLKDMNNYIYDDTLILDGLNIILNKNKKYEEMRKNNEK